MEAYAGRQFVGIDLHRRRSVIVRTTEAGEVLESVRIVNDVERLASVMARAGECPEVVLEATYGWYWAVDALQAGGASVHLAHPLGVKAFEYRRVKNDLLTELVDRSFGRSVRDRVVLARFRSRDQRRGRAARVVQVGGAAARSP
jgi:transposase